MHLVKTLPAIVAYLAYMGQAAPQERTSTVQAPPDLDFPLPTPINTPSPMHPGAFETCEQFFRARPGDTCEDAASLHIISFEEFLHINPQIFPAGGCRSGGFVPDFWYCVKAMPQRRLPDAGFGIGNRTDRATGSRIGSPPPPQTRIDMNTGSRIETSSTRSFFRGRQPAPTSTMTPSPPPTSTSTSPTSSPSPSPAPTSAPPTPTQATCEKDNCWRAFKLARGGARISQSSWCSEFLASSCTAREMEGLTGVPNLVSLQCTQDTPCSVVRSGCACYTAGAMDSPRESSWW